MDTAEQTPIKNLPGISCYCPTFGRPKSIHDSTIKSFLDQDWPGPKELVILNDCKYQKLIYNHPEIKIINIDDRINNLGVKFNETIKHCKYDWLATWDDDDIFLKHRLSYSFSRLFNDTIFHTMDAFIERPARNLKPFSNYCHSTHLFHKNLFYDVNKYDEIDAYYIDLQLIKKIENKIGTYKQDIQNLLDRFYIYRWETSGSYHSSGIRSAKIDISKIIEHHISIKINNGSVESGEIILEPKWPYNFYDLLPS